MSGHSKWAQIKRKKAAEDLKKGRLFSRLTREISLAVSGGASPDPEKNFRLRLALEKARSANMPKENIKRALDRGAVRGEESQSLTEASYEVFLPAGAAAIIEAISDNKNRLNAEIRKILERGGGRVGEPGSVSYLFEPTGLLVVENVGNLEKLLEAAINAGASDLEETNGGIEVYTPPKKLYSVKKVLERMGFKIRAAEPFQRPRTLVKIKDPLRVKKILALIEELENHEEVQKVYANFDIPNELLKSETSPKLNS